ncbi:MAG TPA: phosphoribosylanthranilate isomerase [Candidatus Binatia bacterium]|nr:phosphoribosylanthranilate isomerase [Candidatus Binatia bacterium]
MSVRVKICGITTVEDALACAEAGADAIGLNFWNGSKRRIDLARAAEIARALQPPVLKVGVFVNAEKSAIERAIAVAGLDVVQLHGDETPEDCCGFAVPVIKAIRVTHGGESLRMIVERFTVDYILLDAGGSGDYGGAGRPFDWRHAAGVAPGRLFLAGGLHPENVAAAIRIANPYAVDTASGVEITPGHKDPKRVREFVHNAKLA